MVLLALWLLSCEIPPNPKDADTTVQDRYFESWCRLYTRPRCVASQQTSCDWPIEHSFETIEGCTSFLRFNSSTCTDFANELDLQAADVDACSAQMDDLSCGADDFCDPSGLPIDETGDCAAVHLAIDDLCPGLYGDH